MAEEKKDESAPAADGPPPLPAGVKPWFCSDKMVQVIEMKTGPAIVDLLPFKSFDKEFWLADIQAKGFMSPFDPVADEIKQCPLPEFLIVTDVESTYGEMFLIYYSEEAIVNRTAAAEAAAAAAEAERKRLEEEEAARLAAEEARKNAVYVDEPMKSRPYASGTAAATEASIASESIRPERSLLSISIGRPPRTIGRPLTLGDRDHDVTGVAEFRYHKVPEFDKRWARMERDCGVQAVAETGESATQTKWCRPVNKCVQYEAQGGAGDGDSDGVASFVKSKLKDVERALQQNETVDIFSDALASVGEDDALIGSKMENQLKELRNFTDLEFSKNKSLACIDWHPTSKGVLAVSVCKTLSFDDRVSVSGQVDVAYVIVWEFAEWIKPQLVLQTPHECFTFKYNPTQPNIVCGGTFSGQPVMWDLNEAMSVIEKKKMARKNSGGDAAEAADDDDAQSAIVHPAAMGHIDTSHKRMIADMCWLEPDAQVNSKGKLLAEEHLDGKSYQFMTIAGDGQALIWDIRYNEIAKGNLPHVNKPKMSAAMTAAMEKAAKEGQEINVPWTPLFRMNVKRLEGVGELSLSEEGELVFADWRPKANTSAGKDGKEDDDEGNDVPEYVQWMAKDHNRPCVALCRSPFFGDMILSVGDWNFHIWKMDDFTVRQTPEGRQKQPIFTSPDANTYLTGGQWSPSRPGVLLISKADGCVDVWDFTDSSNRPSATLMTTPSRITSMEFLTGKTASPNKQQLLAIGDVVGSLHVFDVPRNLWKPLANEHNTMLNFVNREIKRMNFSEERQKAREVEYTTQSKEKEAEGGGGGGEAPPPPPPAEAGWEAGAGDAEEDEDEAEIMAAEEAAYKELEARFVEQLGLGPPAGEEEAA
ncbi:hypothetical protein TeGR_g4809 [Tetraparma gracilis]|uniref:Uncharacterized protein n=1 Tax=Tetraparma gracilis TaxID=2962635 RepID=A0ABQ6N9N9_9STRA|nr:hypothetical protein TeGR_g4809 [Tetraparma gracilis]